jgi:hypothetical protein
VITVAICVGVPLGTLVAGFIKAHLSGSFDPAWYRRTV